MTADANKQIVIDMWKSFSTRDAARIEPFFSDDAVWVAPQDNATAKFLGERSGMIGSAQIVRFILEQFPKVFVRDVKLDFKGIYGDDETVVVELVLSATVSNGRPYKNDYCFIHILRDGKVVEIREFMDTYNGHRMIYGSEATI
jgi:ketosteroid isomerase-like protein